MEEHRLKVFENKELRGILGSERDKIKKKRLQKIHNQELHTLYYSANIISGVKQGG
jgi:hypothetical protein